MESESFSGCGVSVEGLRPQEGSRRTTIDSPDAVRRMTAPLRDWHRSEDDVTTASG
jgi:hypothetical protein